MHDIIITGASRGLGDALARQYLRSGYRLFCCARSANQELEQAAEEQEISLTYLQVNLAADIGAEPLLEAWQNAQASAPAQSVTLIHNAGILDPIGLIGQELVEEAITRALLVNLGAVMQVSAAWIQQAQDLAIPKKILAISSGAARRPVPGWSTYCSTKAAVDRYMECVAAEQVEQAYPVQAVSLAPGVIDTDMQALIRQQEVSRFPGVDRFLKLKADDALWSPEFTAEGIATYLERPEFGAEVIDDLRQHWG
ncbi:MAG: SDR family NAD(P)-dependent oxidoreductase [Bacteroidota bacterium]